MRASVPAKAILLGVTALGLLTLAPRLAAATSRTWFLTGRCCGTGCYDERCVRKCLPLRGELALDDVGYRAPADPCPYGGDPVADEVGTVRPGPRGSLVLEPSNPDEVVAGVEACLARRFDVRSLVLRGRRARIRLRTDGTGLRGRSRTGLAVVIAGRRLGITLSCRFRGVEAIPTAVPEAMDLEGVVPMVDALD
jgi:hypothetical protein